MIVLVCFQSVPTPATPSFLFTRCTVVGDLTDVGGCQLQPEGQNGQVQAISNDLTTLSLNPAGTGRNPNNAFFQRGSYLVMQPVPLGLIATFPFTVESA